MKILIFSTAYAPWWGGAEIAVKEITDRLPEIEFDLLTVNLSGREKPVEKIGNVTVYRVGSGSLGKFLLLFRGYFFAKRLHRKNKYSVAWSVMASQASVAAAFFKMAFPAVKLVLTLQEGDEESHLKRYVGGSSILYALFIRPWHRLVFKKADRATAISSYLKERALASGIRCSVDIIPNGVDIQTFSKMYSEDELSSLKKNLGIDSEQKVLVTTSRLVKKNAVGDIVRAVEFLPDTVSLVVVGTGQERTDLKKLADEKGLSGKVIFAGEVPHGEIPKYLHVADVFVRPSLSEGMGNSFIEAMAAGVPVVATPVGGIVDFLKDGETGLFCNVGDPKSIASAVERLLNDPAFRDRVRRQAAALVMERYDWRPIAAEMKRVFMV